MELQERWPPSYDYEDLRDTIRLLTERSDDFIATFYSNSPAVADVSFCQGDVLTLDARVPLIGEDGTVVTVDSPSFWMLFSNTCDLQRDIEDVPYASLMPVFDEGEIPDAIYRSLLRYEHSRQFYLPPWRDDQTNCTFLMDATMPVSVVRSALNNHARVEARLSQPSWYLLNCFLVRYLARDDGRFD